MPLTREQMDVLIERLGVLCREAEELRAQLQRAMVARARADLPNHRGQPERRAKPRGKKR